MDDWSEAKKGEFVFKLSGKVPRTILDIGCGTGRFLNYCAARYGTEGVGVDLDPCVIAQAKEEQLSDGVAIHVMDGTKLSDQIQSRRYDLVMLMGSRVVDFALFPTEAVREHLAGYFELVAPDGCLAIVENTDFSGRVEPRAGWHMKTAKDIRALAYLPGSRIFFVKGIARAGRLMPNRMVAGILSDPIRLACNALGSVCSYVIITDKVESPT